MLISIDGRLSTLYHDMLEAATAGALIAAPARRCSSARRLPQMWPLSRGVLQCMLPEGERGTIEC